MVTQTQKILSRVRIGIDLHGVIDKEPRKMKALMEMLMKMKMNVYIVTGPPRNQIEKELQELKLEYGIHYTNILSIVDFLKTHGVEMWKEDETNWWADDEHWWDAKARICKTHNISVMIDDSDRYAPAFDLVDCEYVRFEDFIK